MSVATRSPYENNSMNSPWTCLSRDPATLTRVPSLNYRRGLYAFQPIFHPLDPAEQSAIIQALGYHTQIHRFVALFQSFGLPQTRRLGWSTRGRSSATSQAGDRKWLRKFVNRATNGRYFVRSDLV